MYYHMETIRMLITPLYLPLLSRLMQLICIVHEQRDIYRYFSTVFFNSLLLVEAKALSRNTHCWYCCIFLFFYYSPCWCEYLLSLLLLLHLIFNAPYRIASDVHFYFRVLAPCRQRTNTTTTD